MAQALACNAPLAAGSLQVISARTSFCSSTLLRPEALLNSRMAGHPAFDRHSCEGRRRFSTAEGWSSRASVSGCRLEASVPPTRRAFRTAAAARVTFLLLAQKKSNPKKMA
jgi:hypothetical protein